MSEIGGKYQQEWFERNSSLNRGLGRLGGCSTRRDRQSFFYSGTPIMDTNDWRDLLQPESRQRIVNKMMDTLKRCTPVSDEDGLLELQKYAGSFEQKTYAAATSQSDYLQKISLKMLTVQNFMANSMPSIPVGNSNGTPTAVWNEGRSLPNPSAN